MVDNRQNNPMLSDPEVTMPDAVSSWLTHPALIWGLCCFSLLAIGLSVLLVPRYLATLPRDYLRSGERPRQGPIALRVLRNVLGVTLVLLGIAMLLLPGQGLLTLLVGLLLSDFPGKHKLVVRLLGRPTVLSVVNKLRAHRGAAPLVQA